MIRLALLVLLAAFLVSGCGGSGTASKASASGVQELTGIEQLQDAFDAHQDVPQLIVLLSPT